MENSRRLGKSGGELSFSALRGTAASGARRLRDPRFVFDPRELAEFDLPRLSESRPTGFLSTTKQKPGATQTASISASAGDAVTASLAPDTIGALPPIFPTDAGKRAGHATSNTLAAVRDALGLDDSKRQEVEDVASTILAKTYGQQQRGASTGASPKPPSPRRTSLTGVATDERSAKAHSDDIAAQQAMADVEGLRTGSCNE